MAIQYNYCSVGEMHDTEVLLYFHLKIVFQELNLKKLYLEMCFWKK